MQTPGMQFFGRTGNWPNGVNYFALLDRDVLTATAEEARETKVLWTIVGGKTVYGAKP